MDVSGGSILKYVRCALLCKMDHRQTRRNGGKNDIAPIVSDKTGTLGAHLRAITGLWAFPSGRSGLTNEVSFWRERESRVVFWGIAIALSIAVLATVLMTMVRARPAAASTAEFDLRVYRDQLREVEKDIARGLVNAEDAERIRTEISRRMLEADKIRQGLSITDQAPRPLTFSAFAFCTCLLYTSPSPRDRTRSRMPSSA